GGARVGEGVDANAEPGDAVTAGDADEAEEQNDGNGDGGGMDRSEHAEVEDNDDGDENPEEEEEFALRDEIGLAGFVDEFGNVAHGLMHGKILEAAVNGEAEDEAEDAEDDTEEEEFVAVNAEKADAGEIGELEVGFSSGFLRASGDCAEK